MIIKILKKTGYALLVTVAVIAIGALFITYTTTRLLFVTAREIIRGFINAISYTVIGILNRLITITVAAIVFSGSVWLFWEFNPEFRAEVDQKYRDLNNKVKGFTGISLPYLPGIEDVVKMAGRYATEHSSAGLPDFSNMKIPPLPSADDIANLRNATTLINKIGTASLPKELEPVAGLAQNPKVIDHYLKLIRSGALGVNAKGAVPILSEQLMNGDITTRAAAYRSLYMIDTPEARTTLNEYNRIIQEALKNAGSGN